MSTIQSTSAIGSLCRYCVRPIIGSIVYGNDGKVYHPECVHGNNWNVMSNQKIPVKIKLAPGAVLPSRAHDTDSGYDLVAYSDPIIKENYIEYDTGVAVQPSPGYYFHAFPRSSVSKQNLVLCNSVATIDESFTGFIKLRFRYIIQPEDITNMFGVVKVNINKNKIYQRGDRIGQLVIFPRYSVDFQVAEGLQDTSRGEGGFGSTGE